MTEPLTPSLQQALRLQLDCLAATLRPATLAKYVTVVNRFLDFLRHTHPQVSCPSQLRRDPHVLGFLQSLHQQQPPLRNASRTQYLIQLRRLLYDLAADGHPLADNLIGPQDFPPPDVYLPKPLSVHEDQLLAQQLARDNDLPALALRLLRATGMRIGECLNLTVDCLHPVATDQWVLKVPLGKLHTERWIPLDDSARHLIAAILALRCPHPKTLPNPHFLLLDRDGRRPSYMAISRRLLRAAASAGCASHITPHRLRHSFASEMISSGVSLPVTMQLLGHKDIRMTLRYVHVSQNDMQREYHRARHHLVNRHLMPSLPLDQPFNPHAQGGILALQNALAAVQQLLASHRLKLSADNDQRPLARLANRLAKISAELAKL
ncbi:MAG: tyrosine-type recombinase/integrase [Deltaproteobacteria bacterium]|nr:tyrosine-type recombinase/integrase [Deltaproteobacteria bacterium]